MPQKGYIQAVCGDGYCYGLAQYKELVDIFFDGYTSFKHLHSLNILNNGRSGTACAFIYKRDNYRAICTFKISTKKNADNLLYEAYVGQGINTLSKYFPIFLKTYGCYVMNDNSYINSLQQYRYKGINEKLKVDNSFSYLLSNNKIKQLEITDINSFNPNEESIRVSCTSSNKLSVLNEYIANSVPITHFISDYASEKKNELSHALPNILFQIYVSLASVSSIFTHYDLHDHNVLCSTMPNNKYITFIYHYNGKEIHINTRYIAKIIDYGRSFINKDISSMAIYGKAMDEKACTIVNDETKTLDHNNNGYNFFNEPSEKNFYISSNQKNISHDLRLLHILCTHPYNINENRYDIKEGFPEPMVNFLLNIKTNLIYNNKFGTRYRMSDPSKPSEINNVIDAAQYLITYIEEDITFKELNNEMYKDYDKLGDLHIYVLDDTFRNKMEFIPAM